GPYVASGGWKGCGHRECGQRWSGIRPARRVPRRGDDGVRVQQMFLWVSCFIIRMSSGKRIFFSAGVSRRSSMYAKACCTIFVFVYSASFAMSEQQLPQELTTIQEAYQASMTNPHSGSGTGIYEEYVSSGGKGSTLQLVTKAKAKVIFDHKKFYVRLDYEK